MISIDGVSDAGKSSSISASSESISSMQSDVDDLIKDLERLSIKE